MKITNLNSFITKLKNLSSKGKRVVYVVGYTQSYAVWVHENLQSIHPVGNAKYLERPARQFVPELGRVAGEAMSKGKDLDTGVMLASLRLQRESQKQVPVDTGALKASAFTRKDK